MTRRLPGGTLPAIAMAGLLSADWVRPAYLKSSEISEETYWDGHLELKRRRLMRFGARNSDSQEQDLIRFAISASWRERMVLGKGREVCKV